MRKFAFLCALLSTSLTAKTLPRYVVLHTDESKLVLEGDYGVTVVSAKTFCWEHDGFTEGEVVYSTENLLVCVDSLLISRRGKTCGVWCP